ncbi:hypothetical protein QC762_204795 [Podospora pseudocomata]|uniref:Uncharacterized protein n=1 Tax=Podospora pseudocomata TaxID=2093779 RepID=A0ABR0GL68_9PEZI|nr:hypothetical protein QC762_204795 [Podospora pseudocomata]
MKLSTLLPLFPLATASAPASPGLSYLGHASIAASAPFNIGSSTFGSRTVFPLAGGTFIGPLFNATVPAYGGDWGLGNPVAGNFYVDARYQLKTTDGVDIYVSANGPQQPEGVLHTRVRFEAGSDTPYGWLSGIVAVGITTPVVDEDGQVEGIEIDLWRMTSPSTIAGKGKKGKKTRRV